MTGPALGAHRVGELDHDLTRQHEGEPIGERITCRAACSTPRASRCRNTLVEVWQANACRPLPAPSGTASRRRLTRTSTGAGRCVTDDEGRYRFVTIKPGPTRGATTTTPGARRTSTSRCSAGAFAQRLVTQMYFPGDPLFPYDPIFNSVADPSGHASG